MFGVLLVPSLFFLVRFFLLVLGLGFRGGFFLFWGPGWCSWGLGFFWFLLVPFLFLFVPFFFLVAWVGFLGFAGFSCHWWSSCVCFFLSLFCRLVFFSSWFFLVFLAPFLFLSCFFLFLLFLFWGAWVGFLGFGVFLFLSRLFFLFHFFLFGGPGWFSWGLGVLLVPVLFLFVPFLLVLGAWVVFLGFGGSSCSFLVSSSRRTRSGERKKTRPVVWGFFLLLSCFF